MNAEVLHPDETIPPPVHKVEHEWLGGIPLTGVRRMNSAEVKQLVRRLWLFRLLNVVAGNILVVSLLAAYQVGDEWAVIAGFVAVFFVLALFPLIFHERMKSQPLVRVYEGRLKSLPFDTIQRRLILDHHKVFQTDGKAEVIVIEGSNRIWSVNGKGVWDLKGIQPIQTAINTSQHRLNEAEKKEINLHLRRYRRALAKNYLLWLAISAFGAAILGAAGELAFAPALLVTLVSFLAGAIFLLCHPSQTVARFLKEDRDRGELERGPNNELQLSSGIPWTVNGEPSTWRLERAESVLSEFKRLLPHIKKQ